MPCCILCKHYTFTELGEPRVDKECPGFVGDNVPPRWSLTKETAVCCAKCNYFTAEPERKLWWCLRPFAFEVNPATSAEAIRFSSRAIVNAGPEK